MSDDLDQQELIITKGPNRGKNLMKARGKTYGQFCRAAGALLWDKETIKSHMLSPCPGKSKKRPDFSPERKQLLKGSFQFV